MSADVIRWIVAIVVIAHGIGHVLFMPLLNGAMRLQADGHSWLLTGVVGDGPTKGLATIVAGLIGVAFVVAGVGILGQTTWWRTLAIAASVASLVLIVAMWDGLPTSSAAFAVAFDVAVLIALLVVHWPSTETIGA